MVTKTETPVRETPIRELLSVRVPAAFREFFEHSQKTVERYFDEISFDPRQGTIEVSGERYLLVRAGSLSVDFFELVMSLYRDRSDDEAREVATNFLYDISHAMGKADAQAFHKKMNLSDPLAKLSAGPVHFAYCGWAFVDILPESTPTTDEGYFLMYNHPYSFEADAWLGQGRTTAHPVCIMNAGYSSGWCAESYGLPLTAKEITCRAKGDDHCRFIMAPPSRIEGYLRQYAPANRPTRETPLSSIPEFFYRKRLEDSLLEANRKLTTLAMTDGLTGLFNHAAILDALKTEVDRHQRDERSLGVIMADLDHFKQVNDTHGHLAGDQLIAQAAERIKRCCRSYDIASRYGGEEFLVITPDCDEARATRIAERVRQSFAEKAFAIEGKSLEVTISVGTTASVIIQGIDAETLVRQADRALYHAKRGGRNRVEFLAWKSGQEAM